MLVYRRSAMKTLPLSEAKAQLSRIVDDVCGRDERVTITRNGKPAAVLVSPDEFESWRETIDILSKPELLAEIRAGVRALKRARRYTVVALFRDRS
jgi:prevent-host-death family protein